MRSSFFTLSILSILAGVLADSTPGFDVLSSPEVQKTYYIGGSLPIVWAPGSSTGTITLTLIGGTASNNLNPLTVIASKIDSQSGSYTWFPIPAASVIGSWATYGVNLTSDADPSGTFQYSYAFHIAANETSSSSTTASSSATTSASTSTTASSTLTSTSSAESSTITAQANTTVAVVTSTATANTTLATLTATTRVTGASNSTATGTATGTSKPAQPTTAGAGRLVAGGAAVLGSVVFALFL